MVRNKRHQDVQRLAKLEKESSNVFRLRLEGNGKRYAHTSSCIYQIMMATLQPDDRRLPNCLCNTINHSRKQSETDGDKVIVIVEHNLKEFVLCILDSKRLQQCKLNLIFQPGEQVAFRTVGTIPVQLTGVYSEAI